MLLQVHIKIVSQTNLAEADVINLKKLSYPHQPAPEPLPTSLPYFFVPAQQFMLLHNG